MSEERYAILFSSATGNTKELADVIRETLPEETCDYFGGTENQRPARPSWWAAHTLPSWRCRA